MKKRSFTLTEVIVATVIVALVFGGLISSFMVVRRYVNRAHGRLTAVNLARTTFDNLYRDVRADTWDTGNLSAGNAVNLPNYNIDEGGIQVAYSNGGYLVSAVGGRDYRQVTINIDYPAE